ncbi:MAG: hypothetical protein LBQ58_10275 [Synergistaceae bacterium]|nr:hypothetical protein [Synergistaceae bacterium]
MTLDYFLVDGESSPVFAFRKLYVPDGVTDGKLDDPIWLAIPVATEAPEDPGTPDTPDTPDTPGKPSDGTENNASGSGGCATGSGAIALMIAIGMISIIRRKTR